MISLINGLEKDREYLKNKSPIMLRVFNPYFLSNVKCLFVDNLGAARTIFSTEKNNIFDETLYLAIFMGSPSLRLCGVLCLFD